MKLYYNSKLDWWGHYLHKDDLSDDNASDKVYVFLKKDKPSNSVYLFNEVINSPYWEEVNTTPANKTYSKDYIEMVNKKLEEAERRGFDDEFTVADQGIMADLENRLDAAEEKTAKYLFFFEKLFKLVEELKAR